MKKKWMVLSVIASVCGAVFALLSTLQHFRLLKSGFAEKSYCSISEFVDCDLVNASSYSEFLGVPIAWWGFLFYLLILIFSIYILKSKAARQQTATIIFGMGVASVIYSIFLGYIAVVVLGAVCVECLGMYLCNLLIAVSAFFSIGIKLRESFDYFKNYILERRLLWHHLAVIAFVFLIGWVVILGVSPKQSRTEQTMTMSERVNVFYNQSIHQIAIDQKWPVWGNPNAKVKIVEFSEFQCPFCRRSAFEVRPFLHEFRRDISYYFVNYPLDNSCNPTMKTPMHPLACEAARASLCANKQGKFWIYHDELFRKARIMTLALFRDLVRESDMNMEEFEQCMVSQEVSDQILDDIKHGDSIYVQGTPSIFLNGRKINDWSDKDFLMAIVKEEIKRSR